MNILALISDGYISVGGTVTVEQVSTGIFEIEVEDPKTLEQPSLEIEVEDQKEIEQPSQSMETQKNIDINVES